MCHTYLVINLPKKGHECEHAIQVTGFSIQSRMCSFLQRCDQSGLTLLMLQHYFLARTLTAGCTHRGDDGWKTPLCAEKSFAV